MSNIFLGVFGHLGRRRGAVSPPPPSLPCNLAGTVLPYYYSKVKQGHQEQQTEVDSESRKTGLMTRGQCPAHPSNGNRLMDRDEGRPLGTNPLNPTLSSEFKKRDTFAGDGWSLNGLNIYKPILPNICVLSSWANTCRGMLSSDRCQFLKYQHKLTNLTKLLTLPWILYCYLVYSS